MLPIKDLILERLRNLYPAKDKPTYVDDHMRRAISEYRKMLIAACPDIEKHLDEAETMAILMENVSPKGGRTGD